MDELFVPAGSPAPSYLRRMEDAGFRLTDTMLLEPQAGGEEAGAVGDNSETFKLIDELDIVAALGPSEKLGLNPLRIVRSGLAEWFIRQYETWFAAGGREATLAFLGELFDRAFVQLAALRAPARVSLGYEGTAESKLRVGLAANLRKSIMGAQNRGLPALRATYSGDATMSSRLVSLAERVRLQLDADPSPDPG